jgi:L-alanine-DL-glutamate epimerase-like enolase superfamily enzyme
VDNIKINKIETYNTRNLCIVKITTEDGMVGFGQTAHLNADIAATVLHRHLAPIVLGMDSDEIDQVSDKCIEIPYKFFGSYICRAASGIDTALWDMKGKRNGKSVCQLLGSNKKEVEVYGSSMQRYLEPEKEAERMKMFSETYGYKAFKLHIEEPYGYDNDFTSGRTEKVVKLTRKALDKEIELYVDSNGAYDVEKAIEMGHFFKQNGVAFFEEPCPYTQIENTAKVAEAVDIPITGGEQDYCLEQWRRIIDLKAVDIAQPDICYIGGLTRALRVAKMAQQNNILCTPHCPSFSMLAIFSLHFQAAISNSFKFMELSIDQEAFDSWTHGLYLPEIEVKNGIVQIPQGDGWGVTLNEEWLKNANYSISELK